MKKFKLTDLLILAICYVFASCSKDNSIPIEEPDYSTLTYVVEDNFNLSHLFFTLGRTGLDKELTKQGQYTLLASSNTGFQDAGLGSQTQLFTMPVPLLTQRMQYHIIPERISFRDLPVAANQEVMTSTGKPVFVTKVVRDQDTLTLVNGAELATADFAASNGYLQVINGFLQPFIYDNVIENMVNVEHLTMFYRAVQKAGMEEDIRNARDQTFYAPNNAAFVAAGYADLRAIDEEDTEVLKELVRRHRLDRRMFMQDYILLAELNVNFFDQTMTDGSIVRMNLQRRAGGLRPIFNMTLRGTGNTTNVALVDRDMVTSNGIVNIINGIIR